MNKFYITNKIAEKLRAKGYPISEVRIDDRTKPLYYELPKEHLDWMYCKAWYLPRIDEVLAWLREEKNLCVEIHISVRGGWYNIIYEIAPRRGFDLKHMLIEAKSYEEAAIAGIEYCLDNLI